MQAMSQTPNVTSSETSHNRVISEGDLGPLARPKWSDMAIVIML
jgi:hypothetical protein